MGLNKGLIGSGAILVGAAGILGVTNPSPDQYADFAAKKAVTYLETEVCTRKVPIFGNSFQDECVTAVQSPDTQSRVRSLMLENTERQNYVLFSLYKTDLNVQDLIPFLPGNLLPQYQAESLGILTFFHTFATAETDS
ncbi:MAG: DUF4359 domain-containing protein [Prochlorotrichaceae cyanobacterium]|jgi:hypothetical protein